jgi:hypothetical protein
MNMSLSWEQISKQIKPVKSGQVSLLVPCTKNSNALDYIEIKN